MTKNQATLLPVLRGETQARLLAALLLNPEREASISDLAAEIGSNTGNVHGEVERLVKAGILSDRRVGRTRLVRDAGSIYSKPLSELVLLAYGPKVLLEETLRDVPQIDQAYIFGSWAARYAGFGSGIPGDIDVLIIGSNLDRDDIYGRAIVVGSKVRQQIQLVFRTPEAWSAKNSDSFAATVKSRPLVKLDLEA